MKVIAIGLNYEDHAAETGAEIPDKPIVFATHPNTVVGPGDAIRIPPISEQVNHEAERAVVIGREAKNVSEAEALDHVFGYANANDVSSRDLQFSEGGQWTRSKSLDTFCPIGPCLATCDEVPDPEDLSIRAILNGEVMQDGTTSKMIFSVAELVSFLSSGMALVPGDTIITGTPPDVGMARDPQLWMKPGDEVSVEIEVWAPSPTPSRRSEGSVRGDRAPQAAFPPDVADGPRTSREALLRHLIRSGSELTGGLS